MEGTSFCRILVSPFHSFSVAVMSQGTLATPKRARSASPSQFSPSPFSSSPGTPRKRGRVDVQQLAFLYNKEEKDAAILKFRETMNEVPDQGGGTQPILRAARAIVSIVIGVSQENGAYAKLVMYICIYMYIYVCVCVCVCVCPRNSVLSHVAQDTARSWFWVCLTQTTHIQAIFGQFWAIPWTYRGARGQQKVLCQGAIEAHVECSNRFSSFVRFDGVSGLFTLCGILATGCSIAVDCVLTLGTLAGIPGPGHLVSDTDDH